MIDWAGWQGWGGGIDWAGGFGFWCVVWALFVVKEWVMEIDNILAELIKFGR